MENGMNENAAEILINSIHLLQATWDLDNKTVCKYLEKAHENVELSTYNNEAIFSNNLMIDYIAAKQHYTILRDYYAGYNYADFIFIPVLNKPALIIKMKWNCNADSLIQEIIDKKHYVFLNHYLDNLLLIGITYNSMSRKYACAIEKFKKSQCF